MTNSGGSSVEKVSFRRNPQWRGTSWASPKPMALVVVPLLIWCATPAMGSGQRNGSGRPSSRAPATTTQVPPAPPVPSGPQNYSEALAGARLFLPANLGYLSDIPPIERSTVDAGPLAVGRECHASEFAMEDCLNRLRATWMSLSSRPLRVSGLGLSLVGSYNFSAGTATIRLDYVYSVVDLGSDRGVSRVPYISFADFDNVALPIELARSLTERPREYAYEAVLNLPPWPEGNGPGFPARLVNDRGHSELWGWRGPRATVVAFRIYDRANGTVVYSSLPGGEGTVPRTQDAIANEATGNWGVISIRRTVTAEQLIPGARFAHVQRYESLFVHESDSVFWACEAGVLVGDDAEIRSRIGPLHTQGRQPASSMRMAGVRAGPGWGMVPGHDSSAQGYERSAQDYLIAAYDVRRRYTVVAACQQFERNAPGATQIGEPLRTAPVIAHTFALPAGGHVQLELVLSGGVPGWSDSGAAARVTPEAEATIN